MQYQRKIFRYPRCPSVVFVANECPRLGFWRGIASTSDIFGSSDDRCRGFFEAMDFGSFQDDAEALHEDGQRAFSALCQEHHLLLDWKL